MGLLGYFPLWKSLFFSLGKAMHSLYFPSPALWRVFQGQTLGQTCLLRGDSRTLNHQSPTALPSLKPAASFSESGNCSQMDGSQSKEENGLCVPNCEEGCHPARVLPHCSELSFEFREEHSDPTMGHGGGESPLHLSHLERQSPRK